MSQTFLIILELGLACILLGFLVYLRYLRTRRHRAEEAIVSISQYLGVFSEADVLNHYRIAPSTLRLSLDEMLEAGTLTLLSKDSLDRISRRYVFIENPQGLEPKSRILQGFHAPTSAKRIERSERPAKAYRQTN
jgi:hypothetical protein